MSDAADLAVLAAKPVRTKDGPLYAVKKRYRRDIARYLANKQKISEFVSALTGVTPAEAERAFRSRAANFSKMTNRQKLVAALRVMKARGAILPDLVEVVRDE